MSYHSRPEFTAPDEQRCAALVKGQGHYRWQRVDHRCPKTANQMRGDIPVCHVHARSSNVVDGRKL